MGDVETAGAALADLVLSRAEIPSGGGYARLRRRKLEWANPSKLAQNPDARNAPVGGQRRPAWNPGRDLTQ
ncbi:hypothetical protein [Nocardia sp. NPDC003963]